MDWNKDILKDSCYFTIPCEKYISKWVVCAAFWIACLESKPTKAPNKPNIILEVALTKEKGMAC